MLLIVGTAALGCPPSEARLFLFIYRAADAGLPRSGPQPKRSGRARPDQIQDPVPQEKT